ncbi:AraC family transcriptional regulator [Flavobacterium sp. J27]|uniref:AraC family transcriptional regulator n=1 Tax=Flavobacterium sp. J27 TaxID=2060419 RepID=UPI0010313BB9|nr:AraC family transcriptional regulator [Flavobacterium sp. J27]
MSKINYLFLLLLTVITGLNAQNSTRIAFYKQQFFLLQNNPDSALVYVNKIFESKEDIDLAFAYTSKKYLLTITGVEFKSSDYDTKINYFLKRIEPKKETYKDLASIYILLGHIKKNHNKLDESLKNYIKAREFAQLNNDSFQLAKIKINIAINMGALNLLDEAIKEIKETKKISNDFKNDSINYQFVKKYCINTLGSTYFRIFNNDPEKNIKYSDSAIIEFNKIIKETDEKYYLAPASYYLGLLYNYKKEYTKANTYLLNSVALYKELNFKQSLTNAQFNYYFNNFQKGDYKIAKKGFLEIIENHSDSIIDFNYLFSHKYLTKIFIEENNPDSINYYYDQFLFLYDKSTQDEKKQFSEAYKLLENSDLKEAINSVKKENKQLKFDKKIIVISLVLIICTLLILFIFFISKKRNQKIKLLKIIEEYNTQSKEVLQSEKNSTIINDEIELKINEGLTKIEKNSTFLDKNFSLHFVAKKIGTNTTYLSNFVNNHKKMSFNDYTNKLRIDYVIKLLIEDKKTRNYTTQALAELLGYKNGASFSRIFKEKTGVTPILFINNLIKKYSSQDQLDSDTSEHN